VTLIVSEAKIYYFSTKDDDDDTDADDADIVDEVTSRFERPDFFRCRNRLTFRTRRLFTEWQLVDLAFGLWGH